MIKSVTIEQLMQQIHLLAGAFSVWFEDKLWLMFLSQIKTTVTLLDTANC